MCIAGTNFELENIERVWPLLASVLNKTRTRAYVLEDIRARCHSEHALCMRSPDGVVVITLAPSQNDTIALKVLLAVSNGVPGAFKRQEASMLAIAAELKAKRIVFDTDRQGWKRLLGPEWQELDGSYSRST